MDKERKAAFFDELLKQAKMITEAAEVRDTGGKSDGPMFVATFTTVADGSGACMFETEIVEDFPDEPQVETVVTLPFKVKDDDCLTELEDAILNMNFYVPLGAFGYYYPSEQMYFRCIDFIDENRAAEELAADVIETYKKIAIVVGNVFGGLERIATGESSFDKEVESGVLPSQE